MERIRHSGEPGSETIFSAQAADTDATKEVQGNVPYPIVSVQLDWESLTGTLDGVLVLQQSNHEKPSATQWDDMGLSHTLDSADGSQTLADVNFTGRRIRAVYTANGITDGTFNAELIAK